LPLLKFQPLYEVDDLFTPTWEKISDTPDVSGCLFCKVSLCIQVIAATVPYKCTVSVLLT